MPRLAGLSRNLGAVLDVLAWAEGTSTSQITQDDGYDIIVTGVNGRSRTNDYREHPFVGPNARPLVQVNLKGLFSSAFGRYQIMRRDWPHYKKLLKLPDIGPESQDKYAIQLIKETRALPLIEAGRFDEALALFAHLWASLPGKGYENQKQRTLDDCRKKFVQFGGTLWNSLPDYSEVSEGSADTSLPDLPPSPPYSDTGQSKSDKANPMPTPQTPSNKLTELFAIIRQWWQNRKKR